MRPRPLWTTSSPRPPRRRALGALLAVGFLLVGCAAETAPAGHGDRRLAEEGTTSTSVVEPSAEAEPRRGDEPVQALVVSPDAEPSEVIAALRSAGGRPLLRFDEPAMIVRIAPSAVAGLEQALPGATVAIGPIREGALQSAAPAAVGFWNRRQGVREGSPPRLAVASQDRPTAPVAGSVVEGDLGPRRQMAPELEQQARRRLERFLECLAAGDETCLRGLVDARSAGRLSALVEHEARIAAERQVDARMYDFVLRAFDGEQALFEVQRGGRPTATVRLVLREGSWLVADLDP